MKRLAIIICNSGLGHVSRVAVILNALKSEMPNFSFDVFVDQKKLKGIDAFNSIKNIALYDVTAGGVVDYEIEFMNKYASLLKCADYVWSDNLAFPLKHHHNVLLTGSFLWFDAIHYLGAEQEEQLVGQVRPMMIASRYFAMPKVRQLTDFRLVGLYKVNVLENVQTKSALLLSWGNTENINALMRSKIIELKSALAGLPTMLKIFVEPAYYEELRLSGRNVLKADFSPEMFAQVTAGVIRPGMGTVTDLLTRGGRVFAFGEEDNDEIIFNGAVIENLGVGHVCLDVCDAIKKAAVYLNDAQANKEHQQAAGRLDMDGLRQTIAYFKEFIKA